MKYERGIGMIEVLVALAILAAAILGFSVMQMMALKSTQESIVRGRALTVLRGGAEAMRLHAAAPKAFAQGLSQGSTKPCNASAACTPEEFAQAAGAELKKYADQEELKVAALDCPNTANATLGRAARQCLVVAWDETTATFGTGSTDCADAKGVHNAKASCFVVEAY